MMLPAGSGAIPASLWGPDGKEPYFVNDEGMLVPTIARIGSAGITSGSPSSVQDRQHTPEGLLLETDDHRIGADQMLYSGFAESCFLHPSGAVSAGVVETVGGFDQHIQAH